MSDPGSYHLLVVDDEELNRDMLSRRLERAGYQVSVAEDGPSAMEAVANAAIDLVVLDINMPGMTGIEVLDELRETRPETVLPIVMASAITDSEVIVDSLSKGANDYITKPIDFPIALARIEAQLRKKQAAAPAAPIQPEVTEIKAGTVLAGRYRLGEALGSGGFCSVYRARHLELEFDVAVKVLHSGVAHSPDQLDQLRREGISSCRVQHPNAVNVYDFQTTPDGVAYLVMELLRGHTLDQYLARQGPLDPARCAEIVTPVCSALAAAHAAGIAHRDIKPQNLFLQPTLDGEVVKVLDFGIAALVDEGGKRSNGQAVTTGTPYYMSPEQFLGDPLDGKTDVFSLGVVLYQMLSGENPFAGLSMNGLLAMHICSGVPPLETDTPAPVRQVVMGALSRQPEERPEAIELARAFGAAARAAA